MGNFHEIREQLGGDNVGPWFVIHKGKSILALMIREDLNPKIQADPPEVWVGSEDPLPEWGETLANDTGPIPLYVAEGPGADYILKGTYEISPEEATPEYHEEVKSKAPRGLSRIVYLLPAKKAV